MNANWRNFCLICLRQSSATILRLYCRAIRRIFRCADGIIECDDSFCFWRNALYERRRADTIVWMWNGNGSSYYAQRCGPIICLERQLSQSRFANSRWRKRKWKLLKRGKRVLVHQLVRRWVWVWALNTEHEMKTNVFVHSFLLVGIFGPHSAESVSTRDSGESSSSHYPYQLDRKFDSKIPRVSNFIFRSSTTMPPAQMPHARHTDGGTKKSIFRSAVEANRRFTIESRSTFCSRESRRGNRLLSALISCSVACDLWPSTSAHIHMRASHRMRLIACENCTAPL